VITFLEIMALMMLIILIYINVGYPLLLVLLRTVCSEKIIKKKDITPVVSLIISCFNEKAVIREKLENTFALDYPDENLEIIVVSDASTDGTDEIVSEYAARGVRLIRQDENKGKTSGLNLAVPQANGDIIVFSDANAMYKSDALRKLVRNFNDEQVGYVVGEARYEDEEQNAADKSENTYWQFEIMIKKIESSLHSVVGGDGAIYAIRKELYETLLSTDINDFVNPMQIIDKGFRGVYEAEAICIEDSAGDFKKEFKRKIRIVNRSFSGLMRNKSVMNPFKTGLFSLEVISHKLIRWFTPVFLVLFALSCVVLSLYDIRIYQWGTLGLIIFFWMSYTGYLLSSSYNIWKVFYFPYYYVLVNLASAIGLYRSFKGEVQVTWRPIRIHDDTQKDLYGWINVFFHSVFLVSVSVFSFLFERLSNSPLILEKVLFWLLLLLCLYIYAGYPLVLRIIAALDSRPVQTADIQPSVTLFVSAYNEENVMREKINNSLELDYPTDKLSIVIASDGSTDGTNDIIRKYEDDRIKLVSYTERTGKIGVINKTVPTLESEIIVFSDANTMFKKDAIRKLVQNFGDPEVGAVSGDVVLHSEKTTYAKPESLYYKYERWIQKYESASGSIIGVDGAMYAIRRELFTAPSSNIILDDFVISMNIACSGHRVVFEKDAIAYESNTNSYKDEFRRKSRIIAGAIQSLMQQEGIPSIRRKRLFFAYVSHKLLRWMVPLFLVILFIVNCMLLYEYWTPVYFTILIAQVLVYTLALSALVIMKFVTIQLTLIPFYFCLVNGAALYGIYKGIFKKQQVTWEVSGRNHVAVNK